MKARISLTITVVLAILAGGVLIASATKAQQAETVVLEPGQAAVCATCVPCVTDTSVSPTDTPTEIPSIPTDTPVPPTATNTAIPPTNTPTDTPTNTPTEIPSIPTDTPMPGGGVLIGPMDLTANGTYSDWPEFNLARDRNNLADARVAGYKILIPLITGYSRQCETDDAFDYDKCEGEVLATAARYTDYLDIIVGWYTIDEPHDKGTQGPTFQELDNLCGALKAEYPNTPCGYNAPATWMANGAPYQHIDMSLSQTNFLRVSTEAQWRAWAQEQMNAAQSFVNGGPVFLSFNADTGSPSAADYENAVRGICAAQPAGITFWSFRTSHVQATMTHEVAAILRAICSE